jgi:hypothetical protein
VFRRKNAPLLRNFATDERRKIYKGESLPLARTLLLATLSSRGSIAAPAMPCFMYMLFFLKKISFVYRLSSIV